MAAPREAFFCQNALSIMAASSQTDPRVDQPVGNIRYQHRHHMDGGIKNQGRDGQPMVFCISGTGQQASHAGNAEYPLNS